MLNDGREALIADVNLIDDEFVKNGMLAGRQILWDFSHKYLDIFENTTKGEYSDALGAAKKVWLLSVPNDCDENTDILVGTTMGGNLNKRKRSMGVALAAAAVSH